MTVGRTRAPSGDPSSADIAIARSLPEAHRADAAAVFDEAFGPKLAMAIPSKQKRLVFIESVLVADHCLVAFSGHRLTGMAGLSSAGGRFAGGLMSDESIGLRGTVRLLGWRGTIRALSVLALANHRPDPGELYVDGIAVAADARGQGIGTRLLDEIVRIAREERFDRIRLDVVDTNPRARDLYRRRGYRVIREQRFGYLARIVGFGGFETMELTVDAGSPAGQPTS